MGNSHLEVLVSRPIEK